MSRRRRLTSIFSVRMNRAEEQAIRDAAAAQGMPVSRFMRQATLRRFASPQSVAVPTSRTVTSGIAVQWDDGRVDGGTFVVMRLHGGRNS